jgi:hypothetical protein
LGGLKFVDTACISTGNLDGKVLRLVQKPLVHLCLFARSHHACSLELLRSFRSLDARMVIPAMSTGCELALAFIHERIR